MTAFLAGLGLDAAGIDLSGQMVAQARARHPDLEFSAGSMTALPAPDGSWDGLICFYALIHMIEDADVRNALAEFRRVLADGGLLLLAVHAGEEVRHSPSGSAPRSTSRSASSIPAGCPPNWTGPASPSRP